MNDPIFSKIIQAYQDAQHDQAKDETRQFILWMAALCGIGYILVQLMGV